MKINSKEAKELLESGEVVAIPTETVYGLAAKWDNPVAIKKIFTLKGRPSHNPLIVHVGSKEEVKSDVDALDALISAFWPGPMTIVLPVQENKILPIIRANLPTCAFRMPNHPLTLELLKETGPLVAPSANLSGSPSATKREHVEKDFGADFPVLDGGPCLHGVESTILIYNDGIWQLGRYGAISLEQIAEVLGYMPDFVTKEGIICPGQLLAHYAPKAKLYLEKAPCKQVIGFSNRSYPEGSELFALGDDNDPVAVAHNLYATLRKLDQEGIKEAWVDMHFPATGLWKTIRERLMRASNVH